MSKHIINIQSGLVTNTWKDGLWHGFVYNPQMNCYNIVHYVQKGDIISYKDEIKERETNDSIIISGFTAYIITNWSRPEKEVFDEYYNICRDQYIASESTKIGASLRDLDIEFNKLHLDKEDVFLLKIKTLERYIGADDVAVLADRIKTYYYYIRQSITDTDNLISNQLESEKHTVKKHPARYYAVYHWILIKLGIEKPFEKNDDDKFPKEEIMEFAKNKYSKCSSQQFYAEFRDFDITNMTAFANTYKGYKERIIDISKNDSRIISFLKNYPN